MVNSRKSLGEVTMSPPARFDIDVRELSTGELSVTGRTFVADSLVFGTEFGFLGLDGTGIVHWDADAPEDSLREVPLPEGFMARLRGFVSDL